MKLKWNLPDIRAICDTTNNQITSDNHYRFMASVEIQWKKQIKTPPKKTKN